MSKTLNETVKTAMHGVESVRVGAEHGLVNTLSVLVKAAGAVAGVVTILRTLDCDDGLAWFGFGRRRHPFRPLIVLGAGIVTGAVAGVMLAPMAGTDLRRYLLGGAEKRAQAGKTATEASDRGVEGVAPANGSPVGATVAAATAKSTPLGNFGAG